MRLDADSPCYSPRYPHETNSISWRFPNGDLRKSKLTNVRNREAGTGLKQWESNAQQSYRLGWDGNGCPRYRPRADGVSLSSSSRQHLVIDDAQARLDFAAGEVSSLSSINTVLALCSLPAGSVRLCSARVLHRPFHFLSR